MERIYFWCVLFGTFGVLKAPPTNKEEKKAQDEMWSTEGLSPEEAREHEYFRYITQIVTELEKDPNFSKMIENVTNEDVKAGKVAEMLDQVGHNVRKRVDEIKRMEVEYQRDLIKKNKLHHMADKSKSEWHPIHHENQDTFEKDDLHKLLRRHADMIDEVEKERKQEFKRHEMEKEHQRRESMKGMTPEKKAEEEKKHEELHKKPHEKIHEPGHKAQLEEVWDKSDGYDPEDFDPRTFFRLHDKNSDGYLDYFEVETFFLRDLDKIYNLSDPNVDLEERQEELERMREHMRILMDKDNDGMVSEEEFINGTKLDEYEKDEEWHTVTEEDQFTESDFAEYEKMLEDMAKDEKWKKTDLENTEVKSGNVTQPNPTET